MPGRRRQTDTIGGRAEAGCAKCCAYCRISPLGSAVCYSTIIILVATVILYLFGVGLSSATDKKDLDRDCGMNVTAIHSVYYNYLRFTGAVVLLLIIGLIMSCCVFCGLSYNFPKIVKIIAAITIIPVSLLIILFLSWLALGTFLSTVMDSHARLTNLLCRNIVVYLIILYLYLFCLIGFGVVVAVWKIHGCYKDKKSGGVSYTKVTKSRIPEGAGGDGGLVGKAGGMKMAMAVI